MKNKIFLLLAIILVLIVGCKNIPKKKLFQFNQEMQYNVVNDTLNIHMYNPLKSPLRAYATTKTESIQQLLKNDFPILLKSEVDTIISYPTKLTKNDFSISFNSIFGNPDKKVNLAKIEFPFAKGKSYKIAQGYNGDFSHKSNYSKYAIDFNLKQNDTICAAADGFVVGVIEEYEHGGNSKKWRDYGNFITLYHPKMNIYTQYAHLVYNGSFVKIGDSVNAGASIGLAGKTGFTSGEHLHFNVLIASENDLKSIPVEFQEGYKGIDLYKNQIIKK